MAFSRSGTRSPLLAGLLASIVLLSGCAGLPGFASGPQGSGGDSLAGASDPGLLTSGAVGDAKPPAAEGQAPDAQALPLPEAHIVPEGVTMPSAALGWLVQFPEGTKEEQMKRVAEDRGAQFMFSFQSLPVAYVLATDQQARDMEHDKRVAYVEREEPIFFHDAESKLAIRHAQATNPVTGPKDGAGNPLDGRGIGIAVVDSGIDATHPDLGYAPTMPGGVVVANYKVFSTQRVNMPNTDITSGHGTHVSAIVAGQGVGDASTKGIAPAAKLYGLAIAEGSTTMWATQAFDWVLQYHNQVNPPIRIVTNSWGTSGSFNPSSTLTFFVNAMVNAGITVVFSAGNGGGDGSTAKTSPECQNPKPGVICVAAYNDMGTGTRDGQVASFSSRGDQSQPSTWPDVSAPGVAVRSARTLVGVTTGVGTSGYVDLSGTSQAAPHVTGVLALMLQKSPTQTPAALEAKIKTTAYKFTDGGAYAASGSHFAKGHGLLDAYAAVL
jgi:serine protease AprX